MPTVKNKRKICETSLSDFSIEQVSGVPFYSRYREIESVFKKLVPDVDFSISFAQPYENKAKRVIEWFYIPGKESPSRLSELADSDTDSYSDANSKRAKIVEAINKAINNAGDVERKFLNAALSGIGSVESDNTTYFYDGQVLFGVWGMRAKSGRKIEDVIREDVLDHRVFTIRYKLDGEGSLSFSSVGRKFGHKLTPSDVPQVTPSHGWSFVRWEPEIPQGWSVENDKIFTAVCEFDNNLPDGSGVDNNPTPPDGPIKDEQPGSSGADEEDKFHVQFISENHGTISGCADYWKMAGECVNSNEVPLVMPEEGYEFLGWDCEPDGYAVNADTVFTARIGKINCKVRFLEGNHGKLKGKTEYDKKYLERIQSNEIPNVEADDGCRFVGWDKEPNGFEVKDDTTFVAQYQEKETDSWWHRFWGLGSGCLSWLLALLLLGLIGLFLWYLFGNHNLNFCGCNCEEDISSIYPETPKEFDCNSTQKSGDDAGYLGYIDMHQDSGTFHFHYDTYSRRDSIVIYDGKGISGRVIFRYGGGTESIKDANVEFHNRYITVKVRAIDDGTCWDFRVDCPD
ncbi:MAG: hypothetical protein IJT39_05830 [Bacteroidales bacterium]|nr:hypothetical protein [Bacteroidales bacterium]